MDAQQLVTLFKARNNDARSIHLIKSVGMAVLGLVVVGVVIYRGESPHLISGIGVLANQIIAGLMVLGLFGISANWFYDYTLASPTRSAAFRALESQPDQIVWVFPVRLFRSNVHFATEIHLGLRTGEIEATSVIPAQEEDVLASLRQHCPRATHGHTDDLAAQFRANPASLAS